MNPLDIIVIAVMAFLVIKGVFRGFIREIASSVGIVLGVWMSYVFYPQMSEYLRAYIPDGPYLSLVSFSAILFAVLIVCNLLGWLLKLLFKKTLFGGADRVFGAGFAAVKGALFIYLSIIILTLFMPANTPLITESKLAPRVISSSQSIFRFISPEHLEAWEEKITQKKEEVTDIVSGQIEDLAE